LTVAVLSVPLSSLRHDNIMKSLQCTYFICVFQLIFPFVKLVLLAIY